MLLWYKSANTDAARLQVWTESLLRELKAREQEEDQRSGCNSLQQPFDLQPAGGVRQAHATARVTHLHAEEACPPHDLMRPPPSSPQGEVVTVPAEVYRLYMAAESEKVQ